MRSLTAMILAALCTGLAWTAAASESRSAETDAFERVLIDVEGAGFVSGALSDRALTQLYEGAALNPKVAVPPLAASIERGRKMGGDRVLLAELADVLAFSGSIPAAESLVHLVEADAKGFSEAFKALFEYRRGSDDPIGLAYAISWRLGPDRLAWLAGWLSEYANEREDRLRQWAERLSARGFVAGDGFDNLKEDVLLGACPDAIRTQVSRHLRDRAVEPVEAR